MLFISSSVEGAENIALVNHNLRNRKTLYNQTIMYEHLRMILVSGHIASCLNMDPK